MRSPIGIFLVLSVVLVACSPPANTMETKANKTSVTGGWIHTVDYSGYSKSYQIALIPEGED